MRAVLLLLMLGACAAPDIRPDAAPPGGVTAREVVLYRDTVTARMSDGAFCTAVRSSGSGPWRAPLAGCPHQWPAAVLRVPARPRVPLAPASGDPWVTLTSPAGQVEFAPPG